MPKMRMAHDSTFLVGYLLTCTTLSEGCLGPLVVESGVPYQWPDED